MWHLFCHCSSSVLFWCLGKAVFHDCAVFWVSSLIFFICLWVVFMEHKNVFYIASDAASDKAIPGFILLWIRFSLRPENINPCHAE